MIAEVLKKLDAWVEKQNAEMARAGTLQASKVEIHIVGQTALLEARLSIDVAATMDVDMKFQIDHKVKIQFEKLLAEQGRHLDPVGHEAWMPEETEYRLIYDGRFVKGLIAEPVYVILSKAKFAPQKNSQLLAEYLASPDLDERLFELADEYDVDLEVLV